MPDHDPIPPLPDTAPPPFNQEDLHRLMAVAFKMFAKDVQPHQYNQLNPFLFLERLAAVGELSDFSEMVASANVPYACGEFVFKQLPARTDAASLLAGMWPYLTLGWRRNRYPVRALTVGVIIRYEDGRVVPISQMIHVETQPSRKIADADAVNMITTQPAAIARMISNAGLDQLHDDHPDFDGYLDPDVWQTIVELSRTLKDPVMADKVQKLVYLIASIAAKDLPEKTKRDFEARQAGKASDGKGDFQ